MSFDVWEVFGGPDLLLTPSSYLWIKSPGCIGGNLAKNWTVQVGDG